MVSVLPTSLLDGWRFAGLVSVVFPIVLLLLTLLINTSSPPAAMSYSREYPHQLHTADRNVPYYVRDARRFEDTYPKASHQRQKFERSVRQSTVQALVRFTAACGLTSVREVDYCLDPRIAHHWRKGATLLLAAEHAVFTD